MIDIGGDERNLAASPQLHRHTFARCHRVTILLHAHVVLPDRQLRNTITTRAVDLNLASEAGARVANDNRASGFGIAEDGTGSVRLGQRGTAQRQGDRQRSIVPVPTIHLDWDEASCGQLVWLYNEAMMKFSGKTDAFFAAMARADRVVADEH